MNYSDGGMQTRMTLDQDRHSKLLVGTVMSRITEDLTSVVRVLSHSCMGSAPDEE